MDINLTLPTLESEHLVLRPLRRSDARTLLALLQQPGVARWWGAYDDERIERDFYDPAWAYTYLIVVGDTAAGVLQFHEVPDPDYKSAGVDITLGEAYRDRGLGTEALRTLIAYLIDERGHHRVTIDPATDNPRAIHTYEKVGFRPVGVMRKYERNIAGEWHDSLLMDLLAEEFERPEGTRGPDSATS
ncbi:MAG: N-acetyltransferase [Actinobacteria bacterium]|nr:N-acetyltransferase [Actinomycetota bacterium]